MNFLRTKKLSQNHVRAFHVRQDLRRNKRGFRLVFRLSLRLFIGFAACTASRAEDPEARPQAAQHGEAWPRWRGPRGNGTWRTPRIASRWPEKGLEQVWKQTIGGGHAGVVATSSRTITMDRLTEPESTERVVCFSSQDGSPIWTHSDRVSYGEMQYDNGPRAAPTIDRGLVFTVGAVGQVNCLDLSTGELVWSTHLVEQFGGRVPTWGYAASPLIVDNSVILLPGGTHNRSVVALDRTTGRTLWTSLSDEAAYATPITSDRDRTAAIDRLDTVPYTQPGNENRTIALVRALRSDDGGLDRHTHRPCGHCLRQWLLGRNARHSAGSQIETCATDLGRKPILARVDVAAPQPQRFGVLARQTIRPDLS